MFVSEFSVSRDPDRPGYSGRVRRLTVASDSKSGMFGDKVSLSLIILAAIKPFFFFYNCRLRKVHFG